MQEELHQRVDDALEALFARDEELRAKQNRNLLKLLATKWEEAFAAAIAAQTALLVSAEVERWVLS